MALGKLTQGHLDHVDRSAHNLAASRDDSVGLLAAQHGLGDLGSVGQVREARIVHGNAGHGKTGGQLAAQDLAHLGNV